MDTDEVREPAPGPNEWERQMLYLADTDGVLAACTQASVQSMRWTCEVAGHPKQDDDFAGCICETWADRMLDGGITVQPPDGTE